MNFVVFALPRSRTAWLAHFLTHAGWTAHHDPLAGPGLPPRSLPDILVLLDRPKTGIVDTGLVLHWREIAALRPDLRMVTVRRPIEEVRDSMARLGLKGNDIGKRLALVDRALNDIEIEIGVPSWRYKDLDLQWRIMDLYEDLTGLPFDERRWRALAAVNIQIGAARELAARSAA